MSHADLIEKLEALAGPDGTVNVDIHRACGQTFVMEYWSESDTTPRENLSMVPRYTASLDAAVALVERVLPSWEWQVGDDAHFGKYGAVYQSLSEGGAGLSEEDMVSAATPAIALLIATLKALQENSNG
ncbi:hypothetical protein GGQ99_001348 [Aminobacter niigataensis]|uniref:Phage ABA sandwich domain-containing protein n=1 Tax=Aminobacter niigataensis TaxID=83265 RepID=A0ABR6KYY0_9HYPH|nr:hypothetical protein [Aminobacter niigataensis]MBB4649626.1 hypothetical protein [Aminobacter niigataensis]